MGIEADEAMKKCPHCGQSVPAKGSTCPLCRQVMGGPSSLPQSADTAGNSGAPRLSPDGLAALERLWDGRSDEALEEAAHALLDYTADGQQVIREELRRRSIEVPGPESQEEESGEFFGGAGVPICGNPDRLRVDDLQGALESHGIACEVRRSRSGPLSNRPWPELWVLDESRQNRQDRSFKRRSMKLAMTNSGLPRSSKRTARGVSIAVERLTTSRLRDPTHGPARSAVRTWRAHSPSAGTAGPSDRPQPGS